MALLVSVYGKKKNNIGKCRVPDENKKDSWKWVDCIYNGGNPIIVSTTKRPTTTQKPLKVDGIFKNRGPGKCLIKSETQRTRKGNQPAWVWVDCDYTGGIPKPITTKAPVKTTMSPVTQSVPRPQLPPQTAVRPAPIPSLSPIIPARPPQLVPVTTLRTPVPVLYPVQPPQSPPRPVRPPISSAAPSLISTRPPPPPPAPVRPPQSLPAPIPIPAPVRPPVQVSTPVRPPVQVSTPVRPPVQVSTPVRPPQPFPASSSIPVRPPPPAPVPVRPPVQFATTLRPPQLPPASVKPPMLTSTPRPTTTSPARSTKNWKQTWTTAAPPLICNNRWCWDGKMWFDKGVGSTEKTVNIFKKPTLP